MNSWGMSSKVWGPPQVFLREPQTVLCIDHVDLNNMFTKRFNDTGGAWNANRDYDMDWSVSGMEWHSRERRMHGEVMEAIMEAEERKKL